MSKLHCRHTEPKRRRRYAPKLEALEARLSPATLAVDLRNTTGVTDGSALRPYTSIQAAVDAAAPDDTIAVAAGAYIENVNIPDKGVTLLGGFAGGASAAYAAAQAGDFAASDPAARVTRISAASALAPVVYFNNLAARTARLEGFTISGGNHGVYVLADFQEFADVTITRNIIENNGPALLQPDGGDFAFFGGGIYSNNATITITDNIIRNNNANRGGGLFVASRSNYVITGNLIDGNSGYDDHAGGIVLVPLPLAAAGSGTFARNTVSNNVASKAFDYGWAGGLLVAGDPNNPNGFKTVTITDSVFTGNFAPSVGGGIFVDDTANVVLERVLLHKNRTETVGGGAIYVEGSGNLGSTLTMINCTVADNTNAQQNLGNGVYAETFSTVTIRNSIFWNNTQDFAVVPGTDSVIALSYSLSQQAQQGTGNISADPLFANAAAGDYHERSAGGRFDPAANGGAGAFVLDAVTSPAIDAGDPASPFALETAPSGNRVNMGVFGNTAQASRSAPGAANSLQFVTAPTSAVAGQPLSEVRIEVKDSFGATVNSAVSITISATGPADFSSGTRTVAAVNGVATFSDLVLQTTGSYTLTVSAAGLDPDVSGSLTVSAAAAAGLAFATNPAGGVAGQAIPEFRVNVLDAFGNLVAGSNALVQIDISTVGTQTSANAVNGVATFSNLIIQTAGMFTATASSAGLQPATSSAFPISAGAATQLSFSANPTDTVAGQALPAVQVELRDASGNRVADSTTLVTLSGAGLNATVTAAQGVASFAELTLTTVGTFTLNASAANLTAATSTSFAVTPGPAAQVVIDTAPTTGVAGQALADIRVAIRDGFGNLVGGTPQVSIVVNGPGGLSAGNINAQATDGIATFSGLVLPTAGGYAVAATVPGLPSVSTPQIVVRAAAAARLVLQAVPSSGVAGQALSDIIVTVVDAFGNLADSSAAVTLSLTGPGSVTSSIAASGGRALFSGVVLSQPGTYGISASATGVTSVTASLPVAAAPTTPTPTPTPTPVVPVPARVRFLVIPTVGRAARLLRAIRILVLDANQRPVRAGIVASIRLRVGRLTGVLRTRTDARGVITFKTLRIAKPGRYTLLITIRGLRPVTRRVTILPASN